MIPRRAANGNVMITCVECDAEFYSGFTISEKARLFVAQLTKTCPNGHRHTYGLAVTPAATGSEVHR